MFVKKGIPPNLVESQIKEQDQNYSHHQGQQIPQNQQQEGVQNIHITEEQLQQIEQLVSHPAFETLRQQAQQNPQVITDFVQMLQQSHPNLHQLISQNPELLTALLMGNIPDVEEEFEDEEDAEDENEDEFEDEEEEGEEPQALELSEADYQVIQNVN